MKERFAWQYKTEIEELCKDCFGRPFIDSPIKLFIEAHGRIELGYSNSTSWRDIWYTILYHYKRVIKMEKINISGIDVTEENYLSLRSAYRKAVAEEKEEFVWNSHDWVVKYIKYVLEAMEQYPIIKAVIDEPDE